MKMENVNEELKEISIDEIVIDKNYYPREKPNWMTIYNYSQSMRTGAKFPPIVVGDVKGKYYLIDDLHRINAYRKLKLNNVRAIIVKNIDLKEVFIQSIRLNIANGETLTSYDKALCIKKLRDLDLNEMQISSIVQMPIDSIKGFMAKRIVNTLTGEEVVIKSSLRGLAGTTIDIQDMRELEQEQISLGVKNPHLAIEGLMQLFKLNAVPKDKITIERLKLLRKYIENFIIKVRKGL